MFRFLHAAILLALMAVPAWAADEGTNASLEVVKGEILLNEGEKYLPVKTGKRVKDGDRLMVMEGATVKVLYDNDCDVTWDGSKIVKIDMEACPTFAGLWIPCVGAGGGALVEEDLILTLKQGAVQLVRDGKTTAAEEGQVLKYGDKLLVPATARAEVNYEGACTQGWDGTKDVLIEKNACPIAELKDLKGEVLVKEQDKEFTAAKEGQRVKHGDEVKVPDEAEVRIIYDGGCDEFWRGFEVVGIDAEACPVAAAVPLANCTPAVFGNMTVPDIVTMGAFIFIGVGSVGDGGPGVIPPPVSP